jgi:hypothetical protein
MTFSFDAEIYKTGINWAVDVPAAISGQMISEKGYIAIKGQINGFDFTKSLVPVKNSPHRLFVNGIMMKGATTSLGETAHFTIEQDFEKAEDHLPVPQLLQNELLKNKLVSDFDALTKSRRKEILRYLHRIKSTETLARNIDKVIVQLLAKNKDPRIP